ncbi:N-acyl homoserine lactonase family protein [Aquimarina sp. 2201CG14-23]|uniref:N-acyl homoserine lactonase family protein n=1 Tax=Aquimarina mycalae TaxID=3040073 RepID=UPI002477EFCC|nr:N-acyl homoserine lactonase family protein [Aquimarina sp. 2201CG14-23]MDH7446277.1 N-acyl homoserine lactonase family protein [Aquimarina sp. 2201CG14-23]
MLIKKLIFSILIITSFLACKDAKTQEVTEESTEIEQVIKPEIKLYTFDGGSIGVNNLNLFAQGDTYKGDSLQLGNAFYVVKHPKGVLLWDTGLPEGLIGNPAYTTPDGAFTISRKDSISNQLTSIGITNDQVDYIAFSHIHFDHTGAANNFSDALWLVQTPEYEYAKGEEIKSNGFYAPDSFNALSNVKKLNGDHDVFGDGSVIIKSLPGHTPGHQVLFVDLPNHGPTLLSGDMYHFAKNRKDKVIPQFNHDIPLSEKSMELFEQYAKEKNAKVYIQHELSDFSKMPKAPQFLN